jgi:hypothetical protein
VQANDAQVQAINARVQAINAVHPGVYAVNFTVLSNGMCHTRALCSLHTVALQAVLRSYAGCMQPVIRPSQAPALCVILKS